MNRKTISKLLVLPFIIGFITSVANAAPSLSITSLGDGRNAQLNLQGDANSAIYLFYTSNSNASEIKLLGNTNSNGSYMTTIDNTIYNIVSGTAVYAAIGGLSGTQSNQVPWPTLTTSGASGLTFSSSYVNLNQGQNNSITVNNYSGSTIFASSNSNPSIASVTINGSQVTFYGQNYGTTVVNFCYSNNPSVCSSVTVNVQNNGSSQSLTFSQNNISVYYGQPKTVVISGGNGSYVVTNNSNTTLVTPSMSGNTLTLNTFSNQNGTANLTICTNDNLYCGTLTLYINGNNSYTSTSVTFSQSNPVVNVGQSSSITVYGPASTFSVSSISNPSIAQASISGNTLIITGLNVGYTTINVCTSGSMCSGLNISVQNGTYSNNQLYLSQTSLNMVQGQSSNVTISGTGPYYVSNNTNPSVANVNISGSTLNIIANSIGSANVTICQSGNNQCGNILVTVNTYGNTNTGTYTSGPYLSANLTLLIGQTLNISSSNTSGSLILSSNTNPGVANVNISGNTVSISGLGYGTTRIVVCQNGSQSCGTYNININNPNVVSTPVNTNTGSSSVRPSIKFYTQLQYGSRGSEVSALQAYLVAAGYLQAIPNGYYGPATKQAVIAFQSQNGITPTGILGPLTRATLNLK